MGRMVIEVPEELAELGKAMAEQLAEVQRTMAREDVRFSVEIRAGSPDPLCTLGDSSGRLGLLEISIEGGEEAGQRPVTINAPELLFGDQQPGADPTFGLIAGSPSLHVAANDANNGECRLDYVGAA